MGQANTSLTKPRSNQKPNALRPAKGTSNRGESLKDEDLPWRMSGQPHTKCFVRKLYRGHSIWHQYAWKKPCESNHKRCKDKEPSTLFTCKIEPKKSRHLKKIDKRCGTIVMKLIDHRHAMHCDCDLEYIKTDRTRRDMVEGSIICEKRDKAILKAILRHDKICGCGAFDFTEQKKKNSTSSKTPTSSKTSKSSEASPKSSTPPKTPIYEAMKGRNSISTRTSTPSKTPESSKARATSTTSAPPKTPLYNATKSVDCQENPFDDESDYDDENIFKGMPRKHHWKSQKQVA